MKDNKIPAGYHAKSEEFCNNCPYFEPCLISPAGRGLVDCIRDTVVSCKYEPMCRRVHGISAISKKQKENTMKKLFISQPMRGKTNEEILAERQRAITLAEKLLGEKVEVIDSFFQDNTMTALECLGESIKLLAQADVAFFVSGWESARGCRIERTCANEYDIYLIVEQE